MLRPFFVTEHVLFELYALYFHFVQILVPRSAFKSSISRPQPPNVLVRNNVAVTQVFPNLQWKVQRTGQCEVILTCICSLLGFHFIQNYDPFFIFCCSCVLLSVCVHACLIASLGCVTWIQFYNLTWYIYLVSWGMWGEIALTNSLSGILTNALPPQKNSPKVKWVRIWEPIDSFYDNWIENTTLWNIS